MFLWLHPAINERIANDNVLHRNLPQNRASCLTSRFLARVLKHESLGIRSRFACHPFADIPGVQGLEESRLCSFECCLAAPQGEDVGSALSDRCSVSAAIKR
jgi:hypothetical protein